MKASQAVTLLQTLIETEGDLDLMQLQQTGPDSFQLVPVKSVVPAVKGNHKRCLLIEDRR